MESEQRGEPERKRRERWLNQHGDGDVRPRKQSFWSLSDAVRVAKNTGPHVSPYPCRWRDDFDGGESAPEHFHVGRDVTAPKSFAQASRYGPKRAIPISNRLGDHFPASLLEAFQPTVGDADGA